MSRRPSTPGAPLSSSHYLRVSLTLAAQLVRFETTPFEVGSDKLGAWIPTWALGRVFDGGKSAERVPELGVPVLSGIYASAFSASLFSYWSEIRPLLVALPLFSKIDDFGAFVLASPEPFMRQES